MAGLEGVAEHYDLVIVGAGLSGAVFAEQAASRLGLTSLIIDKRDHIGAAALPRRAQRAGPPECPPPPPAAAAAGGWWAVRRA
jgi:flavin-dependent dehydrogenase